jgi:predicted AAA+ superfamily ATPase
MEQILVNQNKHWANQRYEDVFQRRIFDSLKEYLPMREILILTGIRRSGKSSLFKLLINLLATQTSAKKILFINCEDPHFSEIWSDASKFYKLIETAEKLTENKFEYLFIDEIQNIKHWEKFVKSIYETNSYKKIFITGSNSDLLSNEYITLLSGRFIEKRIYPLSFIEILELNNLSNYLEIVSENAKALNLLDNYLLYGGFPEVFKTTKPELKSELLTNYYQTIVLKDCILNKKIRETDHFQQLAFYALNNCSSVYTYNSIAKATGGNENTVQNYLRALIESYVLYEIKNFRFSVKTNSLSKNKVYGTDNGLIQAVKYNFSSDKGKMLENAVFVEIMKTNKYKVFFYNDKFECDFILKANDELIAVQVCYELNAGNTSREINGLQKAANLFNISKLIIVTYNQKVFLENIEVLSFIEFCLYLKQ